MEKRVYKTILIMIMCLMVLNGCGKKEEENKTINEFEQNVSIETPEPVTEMSEAMDDILKQDEESGKEIENTETEYTVNLNDDAKWAAYYDEFMETSLQEIYGKNIKMDCIIKTQGLEMLLSMADIGDANYRGIGLGDYIYEMYITNEKIYACSLIDGKRNWKSVVNEEGINSENSNVNLFGDVSILSGNSDSVSDIPLSSIMELKSYGGAVEEDVVCDILKCQIMSLEYKPEVELYIIRETGKLHHMNMDIEKNGVMMSYEVYYKELEEIEIPLEARVSPEGTVDDLNQLQNDVMNAYYASVS